MLILERNSDGAISAIRQAGPGEDGEPVSLLDEEVVEFLRESGEIDALTHLLSLTDTSIIRVLEDLIDLLIRKHVILFTELPEEAQEKIRERKAIRRRLGNDSFMVDDIL